MLSVLPERITQNRPTDNMCNIFVRVYHQNHWQYQDGPLLCRPKIYRNKKIIMKE